MVVSLNMLSSYIYTYMLITTFRVYTYIILLHSINNLSETLQKPLHHVTILMPQHLTHWRLVSLEPFTFTHITRNSNSCMAKINICLKHYVIRYGNAQPISLSNTPIHWSFNEAADTDTLSITHIVKISYKQGTYIWWHISK